MKRVSSIDITRGIVMVIMALDHARDMLHVHAVVQSPTDLTTTTPILFFTRWITYLCAPVFVFLAGTSVFLAQKRKNNISESRKFLLKRGIWLIFYPNLFEVIETIGFSFLVLSILLKVPARLLLAMGLIVIFGHDLFTILPLTPGTFSNKLLSPLFTLTPIPLFANHLMLVAYPPVPWLGIMLTGFGAGTLFEIGQTSRKRILMICGLTSILLFVAVRFTNLYGDPAIWSKQRSLSYTFLSFINITKYPPSLLFTLVTLGVMCIILSVTEGLTNKATDLFNVYGRVPLFYFILHFYLVHTVLILILFCQGIHWSEMDFVSGSFGRPKGHVTGLPLWGVYLVWLAVVAVLYRPCRWFGQYKSAHKDWWLSYL